MMFQDAWNGMLKLIETFQRVAEQATPLILDGMKLTVFVSVASILIGIIIGLLACFMKMSRFPLWRWIANTYVWVIRGTPMLVQGMFFYFGANQVLSQMIPGFGLDVVAASVITVSLNAGAYLTEIFRSGINAVPKGQSEAARSLGLSHWKTMRKVVLPQAVRIVIPSMVNQFIITIKDTSILSAIGLAEMTNRSGIYAGASYLYFETYIYVGLFYLAILSVLMIISNKLEGAINYERKN